MGTTMLHMLVVVDWLGDAVLADYRAPEDEDDFDQAESDVRDAIEHMAVEESRDTGPWLFTGSWDADGDLEGTWRRLTADEAVRWATDGRLWPVPAYLAGDDK